MDLAKNKCNKNLNLIKNNIDHSPDRIKYVKENLKYMIQYIKKIRRENPEFSIEDLNDMLYYKTKQAISTMSSPTRSDIYLGKTVENLTKNLDMFYKEMEKVNREKILANESKSYRYTSNMDRNIKLITEDILTVLLNQSPSELKKRFVSNKLDNSVLQEGVKKIIEAFNKEYGKEIKEKYALKLANVIKILDEMGFLKKYNNKNNRVLGEMKLEMLKYEYEAKDNKFGITDLKNIEFVRRFSLEEIIAMTSFYTNRLAKEVIDYNESLYIGNKIGLINEIFRNENYELQISDEELREIIAQLEFLSDISSKIVKESANISTTNYGENKIIPELHKNKVRKKAIETYEKDYNDLYTDLFLTQYNNDFEKDLDITTILALDRYNLYLVKDFAIESLMVMLVDKSKNSNMNWGYIPETKNGKNSIQNKEKFVLIGMDMKGYNMPIMLHFERDKLETFLKNYTGKTELPVYEGDEDMNVTWKGFITTQVYMPLTKEQRKGLKQTELHSLDYRYRFIEHIKWMMLPNRCPNYLRDSQGNKKPRKYVDVVSGRIYSSGEEPEL